MWSRFVALVGGAVLAFAPAPLGAQELAPGHDLSVALAAGGSEPSETSSFSIGRRMPDSPLAFRGGLFPPGAGSRGASWVPGSRTAASTSAASS